MPLDHFWLLLPMTLLIWWATRNSHRSPLPHFVLLGVGTLILAGACLSGVTLLETTAAGRALFEALAGFSEVDVTQRRGLL